MDPESRRFSPLNAPQRAAIELFCAEARPWALRQARRTYRHLPTELQEQAVEQAMLELRTGAHANVDRRTLHAAFAEALSDALRRVHSGWCLNQASASWRREGLVAVPADREGDSAAATVARLVDEGLGGLERAVLQLEIGARRDSRTGRAALRLGPRQYSRHREEGLSKLRSAIRSQLAGHVCAEHLDRVTLAATGDGTAAANLAAGAGRCRSCAREADGLRRILHQRLAIAPWPLAIKPAGVVAAKLGALGALFGGKGSGLTAALSTGPLGGTGVVAAALAAAALGSGTAAIVDSDDTPILNRGAAATSVHRTAGAATPSRPAARATTASAAPSKPASAPTRKAATRKAKVAKPKAPAATTASTGATATAAAPAATGAPIQLAVPDVKTTTRQTLDKVKQTADRVTSRVPAVKQPVDTVLRGAQDAVDRVTGAVDALLKPQK